MSTAVGIVGLGPMGLAIASHLRDAGFTVVGTSRSEPTRHSAQAAGIEVVADARAVGERILATNGASRCSVVITSLPAGPQVRDACLGAPGLVDGEPDGRAVLIDTGTCAPRDAQASPPASERAAGAASTRQSPADRAAPARERSPS